MLIANAWAQDVANVAVGNNAADGLRAAIFTWGWFPLILAVFYFLVFRPEGQRQKQHIAMLKGLTKGDVVETQAGYWVVVTQVQDKFVKVKQGNQEIVMNRQAVARKLSADEAKAAGVK